MISVSDGLISPHKRTKKEKNTYENARCSADSRILSLTRTHGTGTIKRPPCDMFPIPEPKISQSVGTETAIRSARRAPENGTHGSGKAFGISERVGRPARKPIAKQSNPSCHVRPKTHTDRLVRSGGYLLSDDGMYERGEQVGNDGSFDFPDLFYDLCQPFVPPFQVFRFLIAVPEKIVSFHGFRFFRVRVWKVFYRLFV